jgi:hypothetical protein
MGRSLGRFFGFAGPPTGTRTACGALSCLLEELCSLLLSGYPPLFRLLETLFHLRLTLGWPMYYRPLQIAIPNYVIAEDQGLRQCAPEICRIPL